MAGQRGRQLLSGQEVQHWSAFLLPPDIFNIHRPALPCPTSAEHPRPRRVKGRVTLVGDAAGYVTKCSGEGIYFAAKSGRMAGEAIVKASEGGKKMAGALDAGVGKRAAGAVVMCVSACMAGPLLLTTAGPFSLQPAVRGALARPGGTLPAAARLSKPPPHPLLPLVLLSYVQASVRCAATWTSLTASTGPPTRCWTSCRR